MKGYQDRWVRGRVVARGYRESARRYELIRGYLKGQFGARPFTVCDIGAHNCYFGLRLTEDFPNCHVMAFEHQRFRERAAVVRANQTARLMLLERKVSLDDVSTLSAIAQFDVVLLLNVLHHLGGSFGVWLGAFRRLGRQLVAEFALADSRSRATPAGYCVPADAKVLGYAESHIRRTVQRPIVVMPGAVR